VKRDRNQPYNNVAKPKARKQQLLWTAAETLL